MDLSIEHFPRVQAKMEKFEVHIIFKDYIVHKRIYNPQADILAAKTEKWSMLGIKLTQSQIIYEDRVCACTHFLVGLL